MNQTAYKLDLTLNDASPAWTELGSFLIHSASRFLTPMIFLPRPRMSDGSRRYRRPSSTAPMRSFKIVKLTFNLGSRNYRSAGLRNAGNSFCNSYHKVPPAWNTFSWRRPCLIAHAAARLDCALSVLFHTAATTTFMAVNTEQASLMPPVQAPSTIGQTNPGILGLLSFNTLQGFRSSSERLSLSAVRTRIRSQPRT